MSKNISFVTEAQIEEKRQKRQEEWDKTRKEDDPEEPPEEEYDPRTLYERLQEQKMKKQEAFDESRKLKNLIKGLDNDEIEFLQAIDSNKAELENQKYQEELLAIEEYKREATNLSVEDQEKRLLEFKRELFQMHKKKLDADSSGQPKRKASSQAGLLSKLIKRKNAPVEKSNEDHKKTKVSESNAAQSGSNNLNKADCETSAKPIGESTEGTTKQVPTSNVPTIQCIGRLPGMGLYDDSDSCDSDQNSDSDTDNDLEDFQVFADPHQD